MRAWIVALPVLVLAAGAALPVAASAAEVHVTSAANSGAGSLRDVIAGAAAGDTVVIDPDVDPTVTGQIAFAKSLTIRGQGAADTTIDAFSVARIFHITGGASVSVNIEDLALVRARSQNGGLSQNGHSGGAIAFEGGALRLDRIAAMSNRTGAGGLWLDEMDPAPTGGAGGAVSSSGALVVVDSVFSNNGTGAGGGNFGPGGNGGDGGAIQASGPVTISGSTFTQNVTGGAGGTGGSPGSGGSLWLNGNAPKKIMNSTFTDSSGAYGGAIGSFNGALSLTNVTVAGNTATIRGGGVLVDSPAPADVKGSIFSGNAGPDAQCGAGGAAISDGGHNVAFPAPTGCPATFATVDPKLGPLQANGGPTATMLPAAGSPALDAIPAAACGVTTDQRGLPRPSPPGGSCDIGAVEIQIPVCPAVPPKGLVGPLVYALGKTLNLPALKQLACGLGGL
jgi:hypothetical protein